LICPVDLRSNNKHLLYLERAFDCKTRDHSVEANLSKNEQEILLELAFQTVEATAAGREIPTPNLDQLPERLGRPTATFVTLSKAGMLRGCIGTTHAQQPLAKDVVQRAQSAASLDPRFPAVTPEEVPDLEIEISLLTPPKPLSFGTPDELLAALAAERSGVILKRGANRATFLPQVWERVPDPQSFLELLCQKASLHRDAWRSGEVQIETYQVECYFRKPVSGDEGS
jgi:AmmeMemoRadiSam system protein A